MSFRQDSQGREQQCCSGSDPLRAPEVARALAPRHCLTVGDGFSARMAEAAGHVNNMKLAARLVAMRLKLCTIMAGLECGMGRDLLPFLLIAPL